MTTAGQDDPHVVKEEEEEAEEVEEGMWLRKKTMRNNGNYPCCRWLEVNIWKRPSSPPLPRRRGAIPLCRPACTRTGSIRGVECLPQGRTQYGIHIGPVHTPHGQAGLQLPPQPCAVIDDDGLVVEIIPTLCVVWSPHGRCPNIALLSVIELCCSQSSPWSITIPQWFQACSPQEWSGWLPAMVAWADIYWLEVVWWIPILSSFYMNSSMVSML
jgi:hypothetical protein